MLYLKLVLNEFENASHDKRELCTAEDLGYKTLVIATTKKNKNYQEVHDGFNVYRISTRRLGTMKWLNTLNRGIAIISFIIKTIQINADIISGHDYIATFLAYIANYFKCHKAKIIYDSHEFELYQYAKGRTLLQQKMIKVIEGFLLRRVDLSLMVSNKIADGVQEIYKLHTRPAVVRNIPSYWELDERKSASIRKIFIAALNIPKNGTILMYHGGITLGRGIEYIIHALKFLPEDIGAVILGNELTNGMVEKLQEQAKQCSVEKRVLFLEAVPIQKLKNYIGAADVEMIMIEGKEYRSLEYCLPNKFFESIQACVPMICTNLPEMGNLVRKYNIGLLVNEGDEKNVVKAILKLRGDRALYSRLKRNMKKAKEELCWENESLKLKTEILRMMGEA